MRSLLVAALLLAPLAAGCLSGTEPPGAGAATGTAPEWAFTDLDGVTHSRNTTAGKPVVLFFMATWCTTCASKTGMLARVAADYEEAGLQVLSVSVDEAWDTDAKLRAWQEDHGQPWSHGRDPGGLVRGAFGVDRQSSFVVLDPSGNVVVQWTYPGATEPELRAAVDRAFAAA